MNNIFNFPHDKSKPIGDGITFISCRHPNMPWFKKLYYFGRRIYNSIMIKLGLKESPYD